MSEINRRHQYAIRTSHRHSTALHGQARADIDAMFGDGYAAKNPVLVAAYMQTAAADLGAAILAKELGNGFKTLATKE